MDTLDDYVEWVTVCPEVAIGLGVPRPRVRLVEGPRLVQPDTGRDVTAAMAEFTEEWGRETRPPHGVILAKGSPTCGLDTPVWRDGEERQAGRSPGLFTGRLQTAWPEVPFIDSGRLHDPGLREAFLDHAMMVRRFEDHVGDLTQFQARVKCTVMSHEPAAVAELGRLAQGEPVEYRARLMRAMSTPATRGKHVNVLQHLQGFVRGGDRHVRAAIDDAIDQYAGGHVPLVVPLTVLRVGLRQQDATWALQQTYLDPYPDEWRLRNLI